MDISITQNKMYEQFENIAFLISEEDAKVIKKADLTEQDALIQKAARDGDFTGEKEKIIVMRTHDDKKPKRLFLVGTGKAKEITAERIRSSVALAVKKVKEMKLNSLAILMPENEIEKEEQVVKSVVEGAILSDYEFTLYKTEAKPKVEKVEIIYTKEHLDTLKYVVEKTRITCANTLLARDLVNENADTKNPVAFVSKIKEALRKVKVKISIYDEKAIKKMGLGLMSAVGQGSRFPPRLVILEYTGDKNAKEKYALVGKGITFDSGGLNLKVGNSSIETMKSDMAGAAAVLGTMKTVSELNIKKNIIGVIPLCENSVDKNAYKPGDVCTAYNGKTVEIGSTDAEGRLILADALAFTEKNIKPTHIIDLATLTGAVLIALGEFAAGMIGNDDEFMDKIYEAGERTYERVWRLPLYEEFKEEVKSEFADYNNINYKGKLGSYAGSIMGAAFLEKFVEKTPWLHLDIAGTAWTDKPKKYSAVGGTGFGVRLLTDFFLNN